MRVVPHRFLSYIIGCFTHLYLFCHFDHASTLYNIDDLCNDQRKNEKAFNAAYSKCVENI